MTDVLDYWFCRKIRVLCTEDSFSLKFNKLYFWVLSSFAALFLSCGSICLYQSAFDYIVMPDLFQETRPGSAQGDDWGTPSRDVRGHSDQFRAPTESFRGPPDGFRDSERPSQPPGDSFRGSSEGFQVILRMSSGF